METIILTSTGQVTIPESVLKLHHWVAGTELTVENTPMGILIKPKRLFPETKLEEGLGCLAYDGPPLALETIENLLEEDIRRTWGIE